MKHCIRYPRAKPHVTWGPSDLCHAYRFPKVPDASEVTIGIIELCGAPGQPGGYRPLDIVTAFQTWGMPAPDLTDVSIGGAVNSPGGDADGEVVLDIEIAAAAYTYCTGKRAKIRVYFAPNTDQSFRDAVKQARLDGCGVISISWGGPEDSWGQATCQQFDQECAVAVAAGVTIVAASGDNDSGDGESGAHVDFPASSPHVIGCGGTSKTQDTEKVWNNGNGEGTGGGFSVFFPVQNWQIGVPSGPGRMVPDLAGNADPQTGYNIYINGGWTVIGGTSAVAPLYAGLFAALLGMGVKISGPILWQYPAAFTDITEGDNGQWTARVGPDPCTGNGTIIGEKFLAAAKPPPPLPPPPMPPPVPPPVPPPTQIGPSESQVLAAITHAFQASEKRLFPQYRNLGHQLHALDAKLIKTSLDILYMPAPLGPVPFSDTQSFFEDEPMAANIKAKFASAGIPAEHHDDLEKLAAANPNVDLNVLILAYKEIVAFQASGPHTWQEWLAESIKIAGILAGGVTPAASPE